MIALLSKSDFPIDQALQLFANSNLEVGLLVPTPTGLSKSILDAHEDLRDYFRIAQIHDFRTQIQGAAGKISMPVKIIQATNVINSTMTLYRPMTKFGDPRLWIAKLNRFSQPWNLIVIAKVNSELFIINISDKTIRNSSSVSGSPLFSLLAAGSNNLTAVEEELLKKLKIIEAMGSVRSTTNAPSGVGDTLEKLLGLKRNANKAPDYKGIEIKASRHSLNSSNPKDLFSKAPNWALSTLKNRPQIIAKYGYITNGNKQLYCTVQHKPNPQGLYLELDIHLGLVLNNFKKGRVVEKVVVWKLQELQAELSKKHKQTFWVTAQRSFTGNIEHFHYHKVHATQVPFTNYFGPLIAANKITMDYTLSPTRDHGYKWRISSNSFSSLFPPARVFDLSTLII